MIGEDAPAEGLEPVTGGKPEMEGFLNFEDAANEIAARIDGQVVQAEANKVLEAVRHIDVDDGENGILVFLLRQDILEKLEKFIAIVEPGIQAAQQVGAEIEQVDRVMYEGVIERAKNLRTLCEKGRQNPDFKPVIDARAEVRAKVASILAAEKALRLLVERSSITDAAVSLLSSESRTHLAQYYKKKAAGAGKMETAGTGGGKAEAGSEAGPVCPEVATLMKMAEVLKRDVLHINLTGAPVIRNIFFFLEALKGGDFVKAGVFLNRFFEWFQVGTAESYDNMAKVEEELLGKIEAYLAKEQPEQYKGWLGKLSGDSPEYTAWLGEGRKLAVEVQESRSIRTTVIVPSAYNLRDPGQLGLIKSYVKRGADIYRRLAETYRLMQRAGDQNSELCRHMNREKYAQVAGMLGEGLEVKDKPVSEGAGESATEVSDDYIPQFEVTEIFDAPGAVEGSAGERIEAEVGGESVVGDPVRWPADHKALYFETNGQSDGGPTEEDVERAREIWRLKGMVDTGEGVRWNDAVDQLVNRFIDKFGKFEEGRWSEQQKALYYAMLDLTDRDGIASCDMSYERIAKWEAEIDGFYGQRGEARQERRLRGIVDRGEGVKWKVAVGRLCSLFIFKFGQPSPGQWSKEQESLFYEIENQAYNDLMAAYDMSHAKIAEWEDRINALWEASRGVAS